MSSHLCFNERFSLELHVNPLTHNRVCCCQMRLENGIFILLEQASKSWTDDGPIGMQYNYTMYPGQPGVKMEMLQKNF